MVKGITRQVILVKSPDPRLFEEAIFIVKEEALAREGVSADRVLKEARQAADGYLKQGRAWNRRLERLPGPVWGAAGALLAGPPLGLLRRKGGLEPAVGPAARPRLGSGGRPSGLSGLDGVAVAAVSPLPAAE